MPLLFSKLVVVVLAAAIMVVCSHGFVIVTPSNHQVRRPSSNSAKNNIVVTSRTTSTTKTTASTTSKTTRLYGIFDDVQDFMKRFTTKANASHILRKGGAEAENFLEDLKVEIDNSPIKFAQFASQYSECPSSRNGGNLGDFGPKQMVKEFDTVVFNDDVGVVHGPIQTQFGYHLILIHSRTE